MSQTALEEACKQAFVTRNTTMVEYVAAAVAAKEAHWCRSLVNDNRCRCGNVTILFIHNQSAIRLIKNTKCHERNKHVDIWYHFIRETFEENEIVIKYVLTFL